MAHGPDRDVSKAGGVMEGGTRQGTDARIKVGSVKPVESFEARGVTCGICMGLLSFGDIVADAQSNPPPWSCRIGIFQTQLYVPLHGQWPSLFFAAPTESGLWL